MSLTADQNIKAVATDQLVYQHGRPNKRQYDSCYYEIGAAFTDQVVDDTHVRYSIQFSVLDATEMNVFIYGGNSKTNASIPLIKGNAQVQVGQTYTIDATDGILVVAYPNKEKSTRLEFVYQLVPKVTASGNDQNRGTEKVEGAQGEGDAEQVEVTQVMMKIKEEVDEVYNNQIEILALFIALVVLSISLCVFCLCKSRKSHLKKVEHRASIKVNEASDEEKHNMTSELKNEDHLA